VRIAWFTPYSTRSAIGDFSRHVTAALADQADVDIWTADDPPLYGSDLRVIRFDANGESDVALADYDAVVYNMGNYLPFHSAIHDVSQRHPGIVILHDRVFHHLFVRKWLGEAGAVDPMYVSRMAAYYGEAGARVARESVSGDRQPVWERDEEVVKYPLDEEPLRRALGAITHSEQHARYIRSRWLGPVRALRHPAYRDVLAKGAGAGPLPPQRADGRLQLTTIGHVIANKHSDRVIRMLAADATLAATVHYTIVGQVDEGEPYATELAGLLRSSPQVSAEMLGWCEEEELDRLMAETDVFVNLRDPVMESGSGSLMRELAFGRPVLCFDGGCFGELPQGAVARVAAGDFDAAGAELRRLMSDAARRRELGAHARRLASEHGEPDYAQALIEFVAEVQRATPTLRFLDRVGDELGAMRADPSLPIFDDIASDFGRILAL
jgi:glycosyltransferase involved in cell wall biosynthesis